MDVDEDSVVEAVDDNGEEAVGDIRKRCYNQSFRSTYTTAFPWVKNNGHNNLSCTLCNCKVVCKFTHLMRHLKTSKHIKMINQGHMLNRFK